MKWVYIGVAQGVLFIALAAMYDRDHAAPILAGGGLATLLLFAQYSHAKQAGLASALPPTEHF